MGRSKVVKLVGGCIWVGDVKSIVMSCLQQLKSRKYSLNKQKNSKKATVSQNFIALIIVTVTWHLNYCKVIIAKTAMV
jgi:hypothetical protein